MDWFIFSLYATHTALVTTVFCWVSQVFSPVLLVGTFTSPLFHITHACIITLVAHTFTTGLLYVQRLQNAKDTMAKITRRRSGRKRGTKPGKTSSQPAGNPKL